MFLCAYTFVFKISDLEVLYQENLVSMAHHNNQPGMQRSPYNLQDERLFSLSGGIPPEHFDELNYVSTRRG